MVNMSRHRELERIDPDRRARRDFLRGEFYGGVRFLVTDITRQHLAPVRPKHARKRGGACGRRDALGDVVKPECASGELTVIDDHNPPLRLDHDSNEGGNGHDLEAS